MKIKNRITASVKRELSLIAPDGTTLLTCSGPMAEQVIAMLAYQLTMGDPNVPSNQS